MSTMLIIQDMDEAPKELVAMADIVICKGEIIKCRDGAQKLDGAKVVEPRWFLYKGEADLDSYSSPELIEFIGTHDGRWTGVISGYDEKFALGDVSYFDRHKDLYTEITAADVAHIRDNAAKAKELGMVLRKPDKGCEYIDSMNGKVQTCISPDEFVSGMCMNVAGHRFCRKAEEKPEAPSFCHQCATRIAPKDSKFCRKCGAEL